MFKKTQRRLQWAMPEVVGDPSGLPLGSHCLSLHADPEEAADHAVRFIAGSPEGLEPSYWVTDPELASDYNQRLASLAPAHVGCVSVLDHEQVHPVDGRLRPVPEIAGFLLAHPNGVTGGADTISSHWTVEDLPAHLEYETWFDAQPRRGSRFLCPYDLRRIPPALAPEVLRELGAHHSHVVLSSSDDSAVRLLQLFVFGSPEELPPQLWESYRWAKEEGLLREGAPPEPLDHTEMGTDLVRRWSETTTVDW